MSERAAVRRREGIMATPSKEELISAAIDPHKLKAEARSRKRVRRRLVVFTLSEPTAEACLLHAVVRWRVHKTGLAGFA
jgi:hypothetical protein